MLENFKKECDRIFNLQLAKKQHLSHSSAKDRILKLKKLKAALLGRYNEKVKQAVYKDLRKHETEAELNEIMPVVGAINHAVRHLRSWMRDEHVPRPISLIGFTHKIKYEPKGLVLIIAPWNFPVNLSLIPIVSAISSGNAIILKPSENTVHSSALLKEMISELFPEDEVAVLEGAVPETTYLLAKPFNHIFFTGSPAVGKIVMKAAANHLSSVSLELGGKSPTIVDESADIKKSAERIAWAKSLNNGQICIAPDYLLIHESVKEEFIEHYIRAIEKLYGDNPLESESYGRIVNENHFNRLISYLEDAKAKKAKILTGGRYEKNEKYIEPTVISELNEDALLWKEEIFGPIFPLRTYRYLDETISYINQGEKPLALYIYSNSSKNIHKILNNTSSGASVINYCTTHYVNPYLPFGGVNNSGIGKGNGHYGFKAFSNQRGIQQHGRWSIDIVKLLYPPYTSGKDRLVRWISRWLA